MQKQILQVVSILQPAEFAFAYCIGKGKGSAVGIEIDYTLVPSMDHVTSEGLGSPPSTTQLKFFFSSA